MPELHGTTVETTVDRVVDGDTVAVHIGDRPEKLRLSPSTPRSPTTAATNRSHRGARRPRRKPRSCSRPTPR
jgi:hypothetical protein